MSETDVYITPVIPRDIGKRVDVSMNDSSWTTTEAYTLRGYDSNGFHHGSTYPWITNEPSRLNGEDHWMRARLIPDSACPHERLNGKDGE